MRAGVYVPNCGSFAAPERLVELAELAERSGWDGFFIWDHLLPQGADPEVVDAWAVLAAVAARTERITIGPLITPLARRRPGRVAQEAATIDRLSGGRLVLGVGLGHPEEEWTLFGEPAETEVRVGQLDEALEIIVALWSGETLEYEGRHHQVHGVRMLPTPVQRPRIPIWSATYWPPSRPDAMPRAVRWDGVYPLAPDFRSDAPEAFGSEQIADVRTQIGSARDGEPFEVLFGGSTDGPGDVGELRAVEEAGATWWLELFDPADRPLEAAFDRVQAGPPR